MAMKNPSTPSTTRGWRSATAWVRPPQRWLAWGKWLVGAVVIGSCCLEDSYAVEPEQHVILVSLDGMAAYLLDDPKASLPTLRKLAREGTVVAGGMRVSNPSVTWPNHTTLISGVRPEKHGVLANGMLVRSGIGVPVRVDPKRSRDELVRVTTVVDLAHAAGLRTAEINWPCTRDSTAYDDRFPDTPESLLYTTPRLRAELLTMGLLADGTDKAFGGKSGAARDWVWTEAAGHLIRDRRPHLLLVHLLNVDSTHHALGPQTPGGYTANAYADLCLSRLIEAADTAGISDRTTWIVVSDHGFVTTPSVFKPNVILRDAGLLKIDQGKIVEAQAHVISEGGIGLVYITNPADAAALRLRLQALFREHEEVVELVLPDRFSELGLPLPREYDQAPDAVLVVKEGYSVSASAEGEAAVASHTEAKASLGSHGYLASNPKMNAMCVLWGPRIRPGVELPGIENIDIAPTIAKLLGLQGLAADGQPMDQALQSP
jgi:predicted AlkP superfamily pyrophosphatase or phosphodiesterase